LSQCLLTVRRVPINEYVIAQYCHALRTKDLIISTSTIYDRAEVKGYIAENRVHDPRNIWESFGGFCGAPRKVALVFAAVISDPWWQVRQDISDWVFCCGKTFVDLTEVI
jgi:hypothetical protein